MINLEDFNRVKLEQHREANSYPKKNGIACPKCQEELYDADPFVLLSNPAQRNIMCKNCNFTGYRYD